MITIHGDERHTLRPDGVMKTGVVRATAGFSPSANAYAVGQRFAASDQLAGPRDWWSRFKAWVRSGKGAKGMTPAITPVVASNASLPSTPGASLPPVAMDAQAPGQSPDTSSLSSMATYITSGFHPGFVPGVVRGPERAAEEVTAGTRITTKPMRLAAGVFHYDAQAPGRAAWARAVRRFYAPNKARINY